MEEKNLLDDLELAERVKKKDMAAFEVIVSRYQKRIYNIAHRMLQNHHDAEDISQEVFFKVYRAINKFKANSSLYTWIYRITVNVSLNHLKKVRKRKEVSLQDEKKNLGNLVADKEDTSSKVISNELRGQIDQALSELPAEQKTAAVLVLFEGFSYQDAARSMGISENTLASRVYLARQKMLEKLAPYSQGSANLDV